MIDADRVCAKINVFEVRSCFVSGEDVGLVMIGAQKKFYLGHFTPSLAWDDSSSPLA